MPWHGLLRGHLIFAGALGLSRAFGLEGGAPDGLAEPVPRVHWLGLLRGYRILVAVDIARGHASIEASNKVSAS